MVSSCCKIACGYVKVLLIFTLYAIKKHIKLYNVKCALTFKQTSAFFHSAGPVFNISIQSHTTKVLPGDTAKMKCILATLGAAPNTGKYCLCNLLYIPSTVHKKWHFAPKILFLNK